MEHVLAVEAKEAFGNGQKLIFDEKDLNGALEVLGELYSQTVEEEGDLGTGVAPIAFIYGDATLRLGIEANKDYINAEVKKKAKKENPGQAPEEEEDEEETELMSREEIVELFEIAWESLDTSRIVYEHIIAEAANRDNLKELRKRLSQVLLRLGDLKFEQGQFEDSIPEFEKCLAIRQEDEDAHSRDLASAFHSLGMAYEFADTERPNTPYRIQAAVNYAKAQEVLKLHRGHLLNPGGSTRQEEAEEETGSGSKKRKVVKARNWVSGLATEQVELLDEAFLSASAPLSPPKSPSEPKEALELCDLIEHLGGKVDDVTWVMTEEALAEERKKEEEQANKAQVPTEQIGFGSPAPLVQQPQSTSATTPDQATGATKAPAVEPNILQPKKRAKLVQVDSDQQQQADATDKATFRQ